jgi:hypothetical protein
MSTARKEGNHVAAHESGLFGRRFATVQSDVLFMQIAWYAYDLATSSTASALSRNGGSDGAACPTEQHAKYRTNGSIGWTTDGGIAGPASSPANAAQGWFSPLSHAHIRNWY